MKMDVSADESIHLRRKVFAFAHISAFMLLHLFVARSDAQEVASLSLETSGYLRWSNMNAGAIQMLEWASSPVAGMWRSGEEIQGEMPPAAGERSIEVPMYFRLVEYPVWTNLSSGVMLVTAEGLKTSVSTLTQAYAIAGSGDTLFLASGIHNVGAFTINKSNLTFVGIHRPDYDVSHGVYRSGSILDGRTRLNSANLSFLNIGFQDASGGDPLTSYGRSDDVRNYYFDGCTFAGTGGNAHNVELVGRNIRMHECRSYNGGHNFAFKTVNLNAVRLYSYNGVYSGIILKGSTNVGDLIEADLSDLLIEGPPEASNAKGVQIEAFDATSSVAGVRINGLRTRNVNMAVYIWPHEGSKISDLWIADALSRNSYSTYGDYLLQPGASNVTFFNCQSFEANPLQTTFVNFGSANVRLIQCFTERDNKLHTHGYFAVRQVNGSP